MTALIDHINDMKLSGRKPEPLANAAIIHYPEEYRCPACDSIIPASCIKRTEDTHGEIPRRKLSVYCAPCNAAFEAEFTLRGGLLAQVSAVHRITGDDLKEFRAEIGLTIGDIAVSREDPAETRRRLEADREELRKRIDHTRALLTGLYNADREIGRQIGRADKVGRVRSQVEDGTYETPEKLDAAAQAMQAVWEPIFDCSASQIPVSRAEAEEEPEPERWDGME